MSTSNSVTAFDKLIATVVAVLITAVALIIWHGTTFTGGFAAENRTTVVYLAQDANQLYQLHTLDTAVENATPQPLTDAPRDIADYTVGPNGRIVYAVADVDGTTDLWQINRDGRQNQLLLDCTAAACANAVWAPSSDRLIYERRTVPAPNAPPGPARLWWLDPAAGETVPVFADSQQLGLGARFSADGRRLSYVVPLMEEVQVYDFETNQTVRIPTRTGEPAVWGANDTVYFTEVNFRGESFAVHIFRTDLASDAFTNISGEEAAVNDGAIAWSPDGQWMAFTRKPARTASGKQLWLMRSDGTEAAALTGNADLHHGPPDWAPDGRALVYQQYDLTEPYAQPEIWLLDLNTGESRFLAPGSRPTWLP